MDTQWARVGCGELSPEQQHLSPGPDSQVHQTILGEVLTPTQRLPKILECGRELGACDPLARGEKETWKSRGGHLKDLRRFGKKTAVKAELNGKIQRDKRVGMESKNSETPGTPDIELLRLMFHRRKLRLLEAKSVTCLRPHS